MNRERGSVTIWILGLSFVILGFGGIALDFWRALATQRELAAIADAATVAAASGIDEEVYRSTGAVALDPDRALLLGTRSLASQGAELDQVDFVVASDGSQVALTITGSVDGWFVGMFTEEGELTVRAVSVASPRLIP